MVTGPLGVVGPGPRGWVRFSCLGQGRGVRTVEAPGERWVRFSRGLAWSFPAIDRRNDLNGAESGKLGPMDTTATSSDAPMTGLRLQTPSRLHFGLLSWGSESSRQFGGVGLMIDAPGLEIHAEPAGSWRA